MTDSFIVKYKSDVKLITTSEAADRLGVHRSRVHVLIKEGRLPAQLYGKTYLINESDLSLVVERKTGRPPKVKTEISKTTKPKKKSKK